jgi:hypothetical protein
MRFVRLDDTSQGVGKWHRILEVKEDLFGEVSLTFCALKIEDYRHLKNSRCVDKLNRCERCEKTFKRGD